MKRITKVLSAGVLTCGLASAISFAGAGAASATGLPTVTGVSPNTGPASGGTVVTITGTNFGSAGSSDTVNLGPASNHFLALDPVVVNSTTITITTPLLAKAATFYNLYVTAAGGTSAQTSADVFTYAANVIWDNGKSVTDLALTKAASVPLKGYGFAQGTTVFISECNADATFQDPTDDPTAPQSCDSPSAGSVGGTNGEFSAVATVLPGEASGQSDASSVCPQSVAQAQEGVACILGTAVIAGPDEGFTSDAPIYFDGAGLTYAATYLGDDNGSSVATPADATYNVNVIDNGAHTLSNDPPVQNALGQPNLGGMATQGLLCQAGTGPGTSNPCDPYISGTSTLASCQASSTPGATAWAGETACTYGAAIGEPVELKLLSWVAAVGGPTSQSLPLDTVFDCSGPAGCAFSANAGYGVADPGGFDAPIQAFNGTGYSTVALVPGKYSFEASGASSGLESKGTLSLAIGPAS
jgi:hypothetical protein